MREIVRAKKWENKKLDEHERGWPLESKRLWLRPFRCIFMNVRSV